MAIESLCVGFCPRALNHTMKMIRELQMETPVPILNHSYIIVIFSFKCFHLWWFFAEMERGRGKIKSQSHWFWVLAPLESSLFWRLVEIGNPIGRRMIEGISQSHNGNKKRTWSSMLSKFPQKKEIIVHHLKYTAASGNEHWNTCCVLECSKPASQSDEIVTKHSWRLGRGPPLLPTPRLWGPTTFLACRYPLRLLLAFLFASPVLSPYHNYALVWFSVYSIRNSDKLCSYNPRSPLLLGDLAFPQTEYLEFSQEFC